MAFVERKASSSRAKGAQNPKKDAKPLVKTNQAKRDRNAAELRDLQKQIDEYVSGGTKEGGALAVV